MTNTDTNYASQAKTYRYEITVEGTGGDFTYVPMTPEQCAFWREKGNAALAEHLHKGWEDDGTPPGLQLGCYSDAAEGGSGIEFGEPAELIVRDEDGKTCFQKAFSGVNLHDFIEDIAAPSPGAFFRTFERTSHTYEVELPEQFDSARLRFLVAATPQICWIDGLDYAGEELEGIRVNNDRGFREATLLQ